MERKTIYSRFYSQVRTLPEEIAITTDSDKITYAVLDRRVDAIVHKILTSEPYDGIVDKKAAVGSRIGIVMNHGIDMIAAMLAVLKTGAAYVPAEPSLPEARIEYMMKNADVKLVITDEFCRDLPETEYSYSDMSSAEGHAYVLYTSGTTGHPKGVIVRNRSVVNYADAFESEFHTRPGDVMLQYSVCSFDIFVEEVFTTLLNGATLAIPSADVMNEGIHELMMFVERHGVTVISGFPYLLAELNKLPELPKSLRLLISGGDVMRASYIDHLIGRKLKIYNTYGPSETTVCATYFRCDDAEPLADGTYPVGHPVRGVSVRILDEKGHELTVGQIGEICIFGQGVSDGYLGNPPEQQNFVSLPDGSTMYRSGDLGYKLTDGNIVFLHRKDKQVMILGKRVEPDEVENVLNTSPEVERGVVRAFLDEHGLAYLAAYFVPKKSRFSIHNIKKRLKEVLSDFMIPEFFVAVKDIPVNKRGKVDVAALPVVLKE